MRRLSPSLAAAILLAPAALAAQRPDAAATLDVFLDCNAPNCESSHIRNELGFVNWVRDRTVADVHLLITSQETGSGGREYRLAFIGLGRFGGDSATVRLVTEQTATDAEERDRLTSRIGQGLMRYVVHTGSADAVRISTVELDDDAPRPVALPADDPWNAWVYSVGFDGSLRGESRRGQRELSVELGASRVTERWKLEIEAEGDYERNRVPDSDSTTRTFTTENWNVDGFVARTVARLWSAGLMMSVGTSTFENQDLAVRVAPAVEYSFFPYEQFSRRQVTLRYSMGANYWDYVEETLFGRMQEQRWDHALELSLDFRQPWGSAETSFGGSHYLHDPDRYRLSVSGNLDVRLVRGLSLDISAGYERVHDQLSISREGADPDEVILELRELATNYRFDTSIGLRYTFGSVYNSIVNPRLGEGRW